MYERFYDKITPRIRKKVAPWLATDDSNFYGYFFMFLLDSIVFTMMGKTEPTKQHN